jgi:hypothetical protein
MEKDPEDALAQAEQDVRECEERVAGQAKLVEQLEKRGQWEAANEARASLATLREGLEIARARLRIERAARDC